MIDQSLWKQFLSDNESLYYAVKTNYYFPRSKDGRVVFKKEGQWTVAVDEDLKYWHEKVNRLTGKNCFVLFVVSLLIPMNDIWMKFVGSNKINLKGTINLISSAMNVNGFGSLNII